MSSVNQPLRGFDVLGVPAVTAASIVMLTMSLVLFFLPPIGLINFGGSRTTVVAYTVEGAEGKIFRIALELSSAGDLAVGIPVSLAKVLLTGEAPSSLNNSEITIDGRVAGEDATGLIVFRATRTFFLFDGPVSSIIAFTPPPPSFQVETVGSLTFRSAGEKNVSGEFALTMTNVLDRLQGRTNTTTFSGMDSRKLQVSPAPSPTLERISFYGTALAVLTISLALPSSARSFRDLWAQRQTTLATKNGSVTDPAKHVSRLTIIASAAGVMTMPLGLAVAGSSPLWGLALSLFGASLVLFALVFHALLQHLRQE